MLNITNVNNIAGVTSWRFMHLLTTDQTLHQI